MNTEALKVQFLRRYNSSGTVEEAISKAISAAVQHNSLYTKNLASKAKQEIRALWSDLLLESALYSSAGSLSEYEDKILKLQKDMHSSYPPETFFAPNRNGYQNGFRVSHSQKSISIFSKHLWCMGKIAEPVFCAVDAIILSKTYAPHELKWTKVSTIEQHRESFDYILQAAQHSSLPVAQWELVSFQQQA